MAKRRSSPVDDYIASIKGTTKESLIASNQAQSATKKRAKAGRPKKVASDAEDAGFISMQDKLRALADQSAKAGWAWMKDSAGGTAPPRSDRAPIQTPQATGGMYQGAVNQINQAAQQMSSASPPPYGGWNVERINTRRSRGEAMIEGASQYKWTGFQQGLVNVNPIAPFTGKRASPVSSIPRGEFDTSGKPDYKLQPVAPQPIRYDLQDPNGRLSKYDVQLAKRAEKNDIQAQREFDKAVKRSFKEEMSQYRDTLRGYREINRSAAQFNKQQSRQNKMIDDGVARTRNSTSSAADRMDFDKANGIPFDQARYLSDLQDENRAMAPRKTGREGNFQAFRMYHLIRVAAQIGSSMKAQWDAPSQLTPIQETLKEIAPLIPHPVGRTAAYVASLGVQAVSAHWMNREEKRTSRAEFNAARREYSDPIGAAQIKNEMDALHLTNGGMTDYEALSQMWSGSGPMMQANNEAKRKMSAMEGMREHANLYGNKVTMALIKYSSENRIPIDEISEYKKNEIIRKVSNYERAKIARSKQFQAALKKRFPHFGWGKDDDKIEQGLENQFLDEIEIDPKSAVKFGFNSPVNNQMNRDMDIKRWMEQNEPSMHKLREENRNVELQMKAERHRHLAEF